MPEKPDFKSLFEALLRRPHTLVAALANPGVAWIFAESTDAFGFMGVLAVGAWLIALFFGLRFLKSVVFLSDGTQRGPMIVWTIVFLLVTMQLTTSLRPILGRTPEFLTQEKKFFIQHWSDTLGTSLNAKAEPDSDSAARPVPAPPESDALRREPTRD